jgi:2-polyprenyl-3-methyl-5-hydroxy-6-metoxy-1,4-benzoquinol methylase
MTDTLTPIPEVTEADGAQIEAFAEKLFLDGLAAVELLNIELGTRLGLYATLAEHGPSTSAELAAAAGIAERYAREWLEQQTVAGVLGVDDPARDPGDRRFGLSPAHAHVLLDPTSEAYLAPFVSSIPLVAGCLDAIAHAYRTGTGVPYADYGFHDIQAAWTRPAFIHHLTTTWLPAIPEVYEKLRTGTARVCEIGCGEGVAAVQIATTYPGVRVDGFDTDDASIAAARALAAEAGVSDRVRFEVRDGVDPGEPPVYDLVFCVEMLHDVSHPVALLAGMRSLRAPGGVVVVVDERAGEAFDPDPGEMERLFYSFSTLHCLPAGMAEEGSAGTGTVIRPSTVRAYAGDAGFAATVDVDVDHPQFRIYRLEG